MTRLILPLALASIAAFPAPAAAGWTAKQVNRTAKGDHTQTADLSYDNDMLRIDQDPNTSVIVDLNAGRLTFLNHKDKKFASVTLEEMMAMRDQGLAQMRAQLKNMPPDQRKMLEEKLKELEGAKDKKVPPLELKPTGKKDKVNGYACEVYTWTSGGAEGEACIASDVGIDMASFKKATAKLSEKLAKLSAGAPMPMEMFQLTKKGFPVRTRRTMKMGPETIEMISETSEIKSAKIDASTFAAPKGYEKGDLQSVAGAGGRGGPPHGPQPGQSPLAPPPRPPK